MGNIGRAEGQERAKVWHCSEPGVSCSGGGEAGQNAGQMPRERERGEARPQASQGKSKSISSGVAVKEKQQNTAGAEKEKKKPAEACLGGRGQS